MSLVYESADPTVHNAVHTDLPHVLSRSGHSKHLMAKREVPMVMLGPLKLYNLDVAPDGGIASAARHAGWQFLLLHGDVPVAVAEVEQSGKRPPRLAAVLYGSAAQKMLGALEHAERSVKGTSKPRVLRIPHFHLTLLWVDGRSSRYLPIQDAAPESSHAFMDRQQLKNLIAMRYAESIKRKNSTDR